MSSTQQHQETSPSRLVTFEHFAHHPPVALQDPGFPLRVVLPPAIHTSKQLMRNILHSRKRLWVEAATSKGASVSSDAMQLELPPSSASATFKLLQATHEAFVVHIIPASSTRSPPVIFQLFWMRLGVTLGWATLSSEGTYTSGGYSNHDPVFAANSGQFSATEPFDVALLHSLCAKDRVGSLQLVFRVGGRSGWGALQYAPFPSYIGTCFSGSKSAMLCF
jgi:hypothetical protein